MNMVGIHLLLPLVVTHDITEVRAVFIQLFIQSGKQQRGVSIQFFVGFYKGKRLCETRKQEN